MSERPLAVVTGGGRGIGRAISLRLATDGWDVVIGYLSDETSAGATAAEARALGARSLCVAVDTRDEQSVSAFFAAADEFGPVSALVNNAGAVTAVGRLDSNELDAVRHDLDLNLFGVVACCKYGARSIGRQGAGAIVNISSGAATLGSAGSYVHYAAAKAGVNALTVGLSQELAPQIRVNAVSPGTIWTDFHLDPERPARVGATAPLGRAGQPEEIAGAVAWLLSDDARYVTGANIRVAGGL